MVTFPQATDYISAILHPQIAFTDSELQKAKVKADPFGMPVVSSGGFALTFFLETPTSKKLVIRCFKSDVADRKQRYAAISTFVNHSRVKELTAVEYIDQGILVNGKRYPIIKMAEVPGQALHKFIESNLQQPQKLATLVKQFSEVVNKLESLGVAHGDLQHGNILVTNNGIVLIDYDGIFVPALKGLSSVESGHRSYQHPARNAEFGPELDRFSVLAIHLALEAVCSQPSLWNKYSNGDNLLFRDQDFRNPDASPLLAELASIGSLQQHVQLFRATCKLPLSKIPLLADFLVGRIPTASVAPIVATTVKPAYQVIDAQDLLTLLNNIGNIVQVIGQITIMVPNN